MTDKNATLEHSCDEIDDGIYLGNRAAAEDEYILKNLCVTKILIVDSVPLSRKIETVEYFYVCSLDDPEENLLSSFDDCYSFMNCENKRGACLVHCYEGLSRGATIVASYLMKRYSLSYLDALQRLKIKRKDIQPNPGFLHQLKLYEDMGWALRRENNIYSEFLLTQLARKFLNNGESITELLEDYWADANQSKSVSDQIYKCKKCRKLLFTAFHKLPHNLMLSRPTCKENLDNETNDAMKHKTCCSGYFIEPMPWMLPQILVHQEKLLCPNCKAKVGSFSWSGVICDCGVKTSPGFRMNSSRVDECS